MKTLFAAALFLFSISFLKAQIPAGVISMEDPGFSRYYTESVRIPVVTGKIINPGKDGFSKIDISYSVVTPFNDFQVKKTTTADSEGKFSLQLDYPFPYQQIWLSIGDSLYTSLYVNTDLEIEMDAARVLKKSVTFSGDGLVFKGTDGELTRLMNNHIMFKSDEQHEISKEIQLMSVTPAMSFNDVLQKLQRLYTRLRKIDSEFVKENPSDYEWLIENERTSRFYADLISKSFKNKLDDDLWSKIKEHKSYAVSNDGMSFYRNMLIYLSARSGEYWMADWTPLKKYSRINETGKKLIDSLEFYRKTNNGDRYNMLAGRALITFSDTLTAIFTIKNIKFLDSAFIPAKADYLKIRMGSMDQNEQIMIFDLVSRNLSTSWCKNVIDSEYKKISKNSQDVRSIMQESKPGSSDNLLGKLVAVLPTGAKLYKAGDIKASDLLANIRNRFRGKAVLLDFWATWCAPCLSEMQYSHMLQLEAGDLPVEFVYLCTSYGSNIEKWEQKVAELRIPGTHIFVGDAIESRLMSLFSGQGFPTYVLINSRGVYISKFQRPSATDFKTLKELIEVK